MNIKIILLTLTLFLFSCKDNKPATGTYGTAFETKNSLTLNDAMTAYNNGKDTTYTINGTIENACQHKGCWVSFKDAQGKEVYINNDEKFVIPSNSKGHKAIAQGHFIKDDKGETSFITSGIVIE